MTEHNDSERIFHLDLLRAVILLMIPTVHVVSCWVEFADTTLVIMDQNYLYQLITQVCPALFMILLGMNLSFSKRSTPDFILKRGILIAAIGMLLNIYQSLATRLMTIFLTSGSMTVDPLVEALTADILIVAGLSLILMSFVYRWNIHGIYVLTIAFLMMFINLTLFPEAMTTDDDLHLLLNGLLSNIIAVDYGHSFALSNWFIFAAIGYFIGPKIKEVLERDNKIWLKMFILSTVVLLYLLVTMDMYDVAPWNYSISDAPHTLDLFSLLLIVFLSISLMGSTYYIGELIRSEKLRRRLTSLSKSILVFYVLQWVVISTFCCISDTICYHFPFNDPGMLVKTLVGIAITVFCTIVSVRVQRYIQRNSDKIPL